MSAANDAWDRGDYIWALNGYLTLLEAAGGEAFVSRGVTRTIIGLVGDIEAFSGLNLRGMSGVAVPVMVDRQRACAAVAIQAPEGRMTLDELLALVPRLRQAAEAVGRTFGL